MTWLIDAAVALSGGRADTCATHELHTSRLVDVDLAAHPLDDCPRTEGVGWTMHVFDWETYAGTEGYCTGDQEVSKAIATQGVWEPFISALACQLLDTEGPRVVVDFGANVGWYSMLAAGFGCSVLAVDADPLNCLALRNSLKFMEAAGWAPTDVAIVRGWIGPDTPALSGVDAPPVRLAKLDIEGAEGEGVRVLRWLIGMHSIDYVVAEVSPVFGSVDWVDWMRRAGYHPFRIPDKGYPLREFEADPLAATIDWCPMEVHTIDGQADVLFVREDLL